MQKLDQIDGLYHLDPAHSALGFMVRHAGLSRIRGTFDSFHGYAVFDAANLANSALMVSIQVGSINTMSPDRDAHLCAPDFFDVAEYPAITFVGTGFRIVDDEHVMVTGDLTIRDVTREMELDFTYTGSATDPFGNERIGFETQARISRKDFGLTWNAALETGGWLISDEAVLDIEASAVKQADQDAAAPQQGHAPASGDVAAPESAAPASVPVDAGSTAGTRRASAGIANDPTEGVSTRPRRALPEDPNEGRGWWKRRRG